MNRILLANDARVPAHAHGMSPHASLKPSKLEICFPNGVAFRVMTSPDGDSFAFQGIDPNSQWQSLPLNMESANYLLFKLPFAVRTKDLIIGILTSDVWTWSSTP